MTIFRACTIKHDDIALCNCTDTEMQPCLSAIIERYLNGLSEFGPGKVFAQNDLILLTTTCSSERELLFEITGDGSFLDDEDDG